MYSARRHAETPIACGLGLPILVNLAIQTDFIHTLAIIETDTGTEQLLTASCMDAY